MTSFAEALQAARARDRVLLDLADGDPSRCGLGWESGELESSLARRRAEIREAPPNAALIEAREAVASYLAGFGASVALERIVMVPSLPQALRRLLGILGEQGGEILVPEPQWDTPGAESRTRYRLVFDGRWRLDRRSLKRSTSSGTAAILLGNPADPTGAQITPEELEFLDRLSAEKGVALVADESFLDSALEPGVTVAACSRGLAFHCSGLGGICGQPDLEADWVAVCGAGARAQPVAEGLASAIGSAPSTATSGLLLVPALLGRREAFLTRLRARVTRNRSTLAAASLREAPWALQWGGGRWAVLQVNPSDDEDEICRALLLEGVAVQPGYLGGFPRRGYLLLSLLPAPEVFEAALVRVEARLRGPASP